MCIRQSAADDFWVQLLDVAGSTLLAVGALLAFLTIRDWQQHRILERGEHKDVDAKIENRTGMWAKASVIVVGCGGLMDLAAEVVTLGWAETFC